jgi:dienelactone hydrolase
LAWIRSIGTIDLAAIFEYERHVKRTRILVLLLPIVLFVGCLTTRQAQKPAGPWNLESLRKTPVMTWGSSTGLVQEVFYEGEPFQGKPTRVFAYLGRPENAKASGRLPAMLLVHGGGGKAFSSWAEHWAKRGYVALAMDTAGAGPNGPLGDGGPGQSDTNKFRNFTEAETRDMWTYHAVAAVMRGHSLLASLPDVDRSRIGITGISWGGYLTCIVAGIDDRLKVAVPVYGCGFLGENSYWKDTSLAQMTPEARELWLNLFDPSQYLDDVDCPILFLNGSNDFAYPLDSYRKSYRLVRPELRYVSVVIDLPHGHFWSFAEVDRFVDQALLAGPPLPRLGPLEGSEALATATYQSCGPLKKASLHYSTNSGPWQKRKWSTVPAEITKSTVKAPLPPGRPLACFLSVEDEGGTRVSTDHLEF